MDDIDLTQYVAIYWVADTAYSADTGHIEWVRADLPHPHYAIYLERSNALRLRRYYERLTERQATHRIDTPLRIIAACGAQVDAATELSLVSLGINEDMLELIVPEHINDIDNDMLLHEPVANAVCTACNSNLDFYFRISTFVLEVYAVVWENDL